MNKMKTFQILFIIMNEFMLPRILKWLCVFEKRSTILSKKV